MSETYKARKDREKREENKMMWYRRRDKNV